MGRVNESQRAAAKQAALGEAEHDPAEPTDLVTPSPPGLFLDIDDPPNDDPRSSAPSEGTSQARHVAKVSAARALVAIRRRTGRPIPADVLALAKQG